MSQSYHTAKEPDAETDLKEPREKDSVSSDVTQHNVSFLFLGALVGQGFGGQDWYLASKGSRSRQPAGQALGNAFTWENIRQESCLSVLEVISTGSRTLAGTQKRIITFFPQSSFDDTLIKNTSIPSLTPAFWNPAPGGLRAISHSRAGDKRGSELAPP